MGQSGALTLVQAQPKEHLSFAKHLPAEVTTEEFLAGKGLGLDALYHACAAGHLACVRLIDSPATVPQPVRQYGKLSDLQVAKRLEAGFDTALWDEMSLRWGM